MSEDWLPPAWSKSSLTTLDDGCPWSWALSKVYGIPDPGSPATVRGTAMHAAVETHERARLLQVRDGQGELPTLDQLAEVARVALGIGASFLPSGTLDEHGTSIPKLEEELHTLLQNWWSAPTDNDGPSLREHLLGMRPVAVEGYFNVDLGNQRPAHGYFDALYWDDVWVCVDHKSAGTFRRWEGHHGHEIEAAMYAAGVRQARGLPPGPDEPVRVEWHVVRPVKTSRTVPLARIVSVDTAGWPPERVAQQSIAIAEQRVLAGDLPKNTSTPLCSPKWCSYYHGCEVTGDIAPGGPGLLPEVTT